MSASPEDLTIACHSITFIYPDEDIKLNSQVFHWPEQLQTIFDACSAKLQTGREKSEDEIKAKVKAFEEKLAGYEKEVDSFRKKEVRGHIHQNHRAYT